jgi:hypothetical protein
MSIKKEKSKPKKVSARSKAKYPCLIPKLNLKSRYDEIADLASYANQLNDAEKDWLNRFASEEINANMNHKGKRINPNTKKNRSRIYGKNNARNRDVLTQAKSQGKALYIEDVFNSEEELNERLKDVFNLHDEGNQGDET